MADVDGVRHQDGAQVRQRERALARLAGRQHGVAAKRQLVELGFGRGAIRTRLRQRRLHCLHRGVYAVGHEALSREGRWMAGVLACGPDALLSHRSAARLWGLIDWGEIIEVTVPGRPSRKRPGITIHSSGSLLNADRAARQAIPVTAVPRTLLDLAEVLTADRLERALEAADRQELLDFRQLNELVRRSHGHRGLRQLLPLIAQYRGAPDVRSDWERDFLDFCRDHKLPHPQTNVVVEGFVVDAYWPEQHLVVELDSYGYHRSRRAFESDRERDARLKLAGYEVLRFTWRQLTAQPSLIANAVSAALARAETGRDRAA